ncbi:MAG: adenylate/guanylate cyclase domain-containing protein [Gammaproteobacteria bacterium]|nr:adenylate/guanylate cyclase domain-containing protein [Gammaproteobacteria bacterium]
MRGAAAGGRADMAAGKQQRLLFPVAIGMFLTAFAISVKVFDVPVLSELDQRLEWLAYDLRFRALLPDERKPDPRIVIVDIDEKSLRQEGRWPWSRATVSRLTQRVFEQGAFVMAMDVVFAEPQRNPIDALLGHLDPETRQALLSNTLVADLIKSQDQLFAEVIRDYDIVLGYTFADASDPPKGMLPEALPLPGDVVEDLLVPRMDSYVANLEVLQRQAATAGFFSIMPDADGVIRRAPLLLRYGGQLYTSLALETIRRYLQVAQINLDGVPVDGSIAVESVSLGELLDIPTDAAGKVLVPYRGRQGSFHYVSAADVLNGLPSTGLLDGAIVLFGTTAVGLYDLRATPVQGVYPGVEVHASIIAGILDGHFPFEPSWAAGANVATLLGLGLISVLVAPFISPIVTMLLSLVFMGLLIALNLWLWSSQGIVLAIVAPLVLVAMTSIADLAYGFLVEARSRRQLKAIFGQYVPPERVEEMNRDPDGNFAVDGESRNLSVLFCDIRSFTTISESLAADELKRLLNHFFTPMTGIIFNGKGTIDKYVGDMIMAFWGAPIHDDNHRQHAVEAALAMLDKLVELRADFRERGWPEVNMGIGINSGMMNVGDMGSEYRRAYTVIGDAVNLGSRLEGLTKYYGVGLIVSEATAEGLTGITLRCLDRVRVKGKHEPVTIFEPAGKKAALSYETITAIKASNAAVGLYFSGQLEAALDGFRSLAEAYPDDSFYSLYLERIPRLLAEGIGPDWNGVFVHTSK